MCHYTLPYGSGVSPHGFPSPHGSPEENSRVETPDHSPSGTARVSVKTTKSLGHVSSWLYELEAPVHTCPIEGCNRTLIRGEFPKWPNQYDRSRWKKVLVCPRHGPIEEITLHPENLREVKE